tara:strand:+ start:332 stop:745 length:414 start_codon:yes stop_codon:yes gene_type:complete
MVDKVSKEKRSQIMRSVRSSNSKMESSFRKCLWEYGFRYRKNPTNYFGKPDLVLKKFKTVIFVDSCFWHGCKVHFRNPSTNQVYWENKIKNNIERDREVDRFYKKEQWKLFRVWEHDIKKKGDLHKVIRSLKEKILK